MNKNDFSLLEEESKSFIRILDGKYIYYGGYQRWLEKKAKIMNGCGPVAGANILAYLAKHNQGYKGLYPYEDFKKENFTKFIHDIYDIVRPGFFGLININKFINRIRKYSESKGINLSFEKLSNNNKNFSYYSCYSFIRYALMRNIPVAVFNLDLRKRFLFRWHWIVITRVFYDEEGQELKLVVSSWGKRYIIELDKLYNSMKLGGGLVYFY